MFCCLLQGKYLCYIEHGEGWGGGVHLAGDSSAPEPRECEKARVVPAIHMAPCHQLVQLALGQHIVADIQACILPHYRLVLLQNLYKTQLKAQLCDLP